MKLEVFFNKFDQFADAPGAVGKMRELVLQLAVQGKLVEQRPKELSARECLRKANKPLVDVAPDESIEPPAGWVALPLGCLIAANTGGGTPSKQNPSYWNGPIPWASVKDVQSEKYLTSTIDSITEEGLKDSSSNLIPPNRLIVVTRMGLGKLAINTIPVAINQDLRAIEPTTALALDFGYLLFKSLKMVGSGVTVKGITVDKLHAMPVSLPPLAEQKRIVAKVDELMALCDRLALQQQERETRHAALARASLARFADAPTPANLNFLFHPSYAIPPADLRKSTTTLAVQGKLVPQDPNDELADELLVRIQAERAEQEAKGAYKSSRPLEPIEETEEPFKLPVEWKWARLRSLVFTLGDGLHGTPEYSDGTDCYFINGNNLIDGRIVIKSHTKTVSLDEAKKHRKPMTLSTVLVSINGTLGSVAFYNNENVILGKSACYFNLASLVDKHFARRVIESPYFVNYALENATGTTIRNLGLKAMNYFPFPLPPLAEQRRIVAKVEQLMALVDELETQLAAARATAANLLSALVAELTGTPNDGKVAVPSASTTGRRGRPRKS